MAEDSGWIKLHRALLDGPIIQHAGVLQVWVYCLLRANWEPRQIMFPGCLEPISIDRGEFVTGRNSLHSALYPTTDKDSPVARTVWRWLETLELMKCISLRTVSNRCTVVSILNYKTYQEVKAGQCPADVPPVSSSCPADVPPVSTNKELNNLSIEALNNIPPNPQGGIVGGEPEAKKPQNSKKPAAAPTEQVRAIYDAYPRKIAPEPAFKAIAKALTMIGFDELLPIVQAYARARRQPGQEFGLTPYPASWFNAGRWNDDQQEWSRLDNPGGGRGRPNLGGGPGQSHDPEAGDKDPNHGKF